MRLLPSSIVGRTVLVLLVGLIVSHVISLAIYSGVRDDELSTISGRQMSERIAAAYQTLESTPPSKRTQVVRSLWGPGFSFTWTRQSVLPPDGEKGWRLHRLRKSLIYYLGDIEADRVRVAYRQITSKGKTMPGHWMSRWRHDDDDHKHDDDDHDESDDDPMFAMRQHMGIGMADPEAPDFDRFSRMSGLWHGQVLSVSLRLSDGSWLNAAAPAERFRSFWWSRMSLSIFLVTMVVIVISIWAVRRSTGPLALFARAAERLGRDVNAPPLAEDGPREVRRAAAAFNDMQRKLRSFIHDRTQMLAAISHDLRTPITRLRLRAELITDEEQKRKMLDDLEQMEEMIASTLSFARDEATDEPTSRFDLAAMLQSLADDALDGGAKASYDGPDKMIYSGRSTALKRVFQNLIDNACQYGGRADVSLHQDEDGVRVAVADQGAGIPDGEHEKVFAPFYRMETSRSRETGGVGLGLAVARTAIRAHGGDITMGPVEQGGFRVTVTLPLEPEFSEVTRPCRHC